MTKCKVISRNPINMVVDFNGKLIQLPTDKGVDSYVNISCKNGIYSVDINITPLKVRKKTEKVVKTCEQNVLDETLGVIVTSNTDELENIVE